MLFLQSYAIQPTPPNRPCISLSLFISLMSGKSSWVHSSTQGLSHHVAGEVPDLLKMVANRWWARWFYIAFSPICFCQRMSLMLATYLELYYCSHLKAMLFSQFGLEPKLVLLFVKSFVILFSLQLHVCDVYFLDHAILVMKLIYWGHSWYSADYRVYISESMRRQRV
jgi:hypothetical protein